MSHVLKLFSSILQILWSCSRTMF